MALIDDINALPTTVGDGQTGHLQNHAIIHAALKSHQTRIGAVEGRVPDGLSLSVDTTVGTVIRAGNTIIYGDTGWRDVTSLLDIAPNSGSLRVRRTTQGVYLRTLNLKYNSGITATLNLPKEWWVGVGGGFRLHNANGHDSANVNSSYDGLLKIIWNTANDSNSVHGFISESAWPTAWVGTAL